MKLLSYELPPNSIASSVSANGSNVQFKYPCTSNNCGGIKINLSSGIYKFEAWGASGGNPNGGKGSYTSGIITLSKTTSFYLFIGQKGNDNSPQSFQMAFNGGGLCGLYTSSQGGGATDIRTSTSTISDWNNFESLKSRIFVAGAGGGGSAHLSTGYGGAGGGLKGYDGSDRTDINLANTKPITKAYGGTQTSGGAGGTTSEPFTYPFGENGSLGRGGNIILTGNYTYVGRFGGGGGSGFFGGGSGSVAYDRVGTGGGGSSYISGYLGCNSIDPKSSSVDNLLFLNQSKHSSGYFFTNSKMIDGTMIMPSPGSNTLTERGHSGNGAIQITFLSSKPFTKPTKKSLINRAVSLILSMLNYL